MGTFSLMLALLCWISASVCQFDTVVVQPGEEVTLQCSNFSSVFSRVWWFKLTKGPNVSCISSMKSFGTNVSWYDGFQQEKFTMTSNFSNVFLNIKKLDVKDSGIYFCGYKIKGVPGVFTATDLQVKDQFHGLDCLLNWILGGVIIFLAMVIMGLVVKVWNLFSAQTDAKNDERHENSDSSNLDYAEVSFLPKAKGSGRRTAEGDLEPNVLYAATR
uniref:Ig-like domain-containing protein n=1 Tax=Poecilia reticulata TaxID=8081 RepID=A0A3P9Q6W4_POERE